MGTGRSALPHSLLVRAPASHSRCFAKGPILLSSTLLPFLFSSI